MTAAIDDRPEITSYTQDEPSMLTAGESAGSVRKGLGGAHFIPNLYSEISQVENAREATATISPDGELKREVASWLPPQEQALARAVHSRTEQAWEGVILEVTGDAFLARLLDMTCPNPEEVAEIPFEEVTPDDLPLVSPGAVFYWHIYMQTSSSGRVRRTSMIRFRRLPDWSEEDLQEPRKEATQFLGLLEE